MNYLADKNAAGKNAAGPDDEVAAFTGEDEELVLALGAAAGIAIDNAGRFAQATRRHAWQAATMEASRLILAAVDPNEPLPQVARIAANTAAADAGCVCITAEPNVNEAACAASRNTPIWLAGTRYRWAPWFSAAATSVLKTADETGSAVNARRSVCR